MSHFKKNIASSVQPLLQAAGSLEPWRFPAVPSPPETARLKRLPRRSEIIWLSSRSSPEHNSYSTTCYNNCSAGWHMIHMHLRLEHPYCNPSSSQAPETMGDHWVSKPTCGRLAKTADDQKKTTRFRVHSQEFLARVDSKTSEFWRDYKPNSEAFICFSTPSQWFYHLGTGDVKQPCRYWENARSPDTGWFITS